MNEQAVCTLSGCDKPLKRNGFCYSHYMKNWRYGSPTPQFEPKWVDLVGQRFGTLTVAQRHGQKWDCVCDCGNTRRVSAGDLNRTGDANTCGDKTIHARLDAAGYGAAHQRCRQDRGPITSHLCIDCGSPARHWSYNHDDPNELMGTSGRSTQLVAYSLNPKRYSPRCVPCHKRFDLDHINARHVA